MINLFEYQNKELYDEDSQEIESFLDEIWLNREKSDSYFKNNSNRIESQRFIQFLHKTKQIKSNKYVGVIHFKDTTINLLPKIFYQENKEYNDNEIFQIQNHILWWLSYCKKIKFPNYNTSLGSSKNDFFEILIYLFSKYTRELLNTSVYQNYEEVAEELSFIKGRLNLNRYINENVSKGRWHKINCTYDSFVLDNKFNRIIKYVTKLLFSVTTSSDSKKNLREILFLLDEVSDERVTAEDCLRITFNPMFENFERVRDYCYLFLNNSISFNYKNDLKLFAFLLPMEVVFEDFVFGFIKKEIININAKAQRSDTYLDKDKIFKLKPDLFIKTKNNSFIADTKYKISYSNDEDTKKGISQNDLYQMLAYAVRFKVDKIILLYPNTLTDYQKKFLTLVINDRFAEEKEIEILAYQIPILSKEIFNSKLDSNIMLKDLFNDTKIELKKSLEDIFKNE